MKRRAAALLLGLLLVLQLALPPVRAEERVYFTAVGGYVLPLSDNTMPFWSGRSEEHTSELQSRP